MKRILLKISGEALQGNNAFGIDAQAGKNIANCISRVREKDIEIVIVVGGGNIYRGSKLIAAGVNPTDSHNMSMLSTVFNAVALKNFLHQLDIDAELMDALGVEFLERYRALSARKYISEGKVVICTSGTGVPFFSTDTAGVLRALELSCDMMIKMTKVDGVYDSDPMKNPDAIKFDTLSYDECLEKNLKILDQTGIILARDNKLVLYVSKLDDVAALEKIISGVHAGTKIS